MIQYNKNDIMIIKSDIMAWTGSNGALCIGNQSNSIEFRPVSSDNCEKGWIS